MAKKKTVKRKTTSKKVISKKKTTKKVVEKKIAGKKKISKRLAIAGLLINIIPGLGSILGGRNKAGVLQLILSIVSFLLITTIIGGAITGILIWIATWIWALLIGIQMVQEAYS